MVLRKQRNHLANENKGTSDKLNCRKMHEVTPTGRAASISSKLNGFFFFFFFFSPEKSSKSRVGSAQTYKKGTIAFGLAKNLTLTKLTNSVQAMNLYNVKLQQLATYTYTEIAVHIGGLGSIKTNHFHTQTV